jgi:hypothetical protein
MDWRKSMGETLIRLAAFGLACACALLAPAAAHSQARSSAGDKAEKSGARGLAGTVVQFEERASRAIVYHQEQGGLVLNSAAPEVPAVNPATPGSAAAPAVPAKAPAAQAATTNGATPLRTAQRRAAPADGAPIRP